ncbi:unnamed protein product, partial [Prorocentrum cordatum]
GGCERKAQAGRQGVGVPAAAAATGPGDRPGRHRAEAPGARVEAAARDQALQAGEAAALVRRPRGGERPRQGDRVEGAGASGAAEGVHPESADRRRAGETAAAGRGRRQQPAKRLGARRGRRRGGRRAA